MNPQGDELIPYILTGLITAAFPLFRKVLTRKNIRQFGQWLFAEPVPTVALAPALATGNGMSGLLKQVDITHDLSVKVREQGEELKAQAKRITALEEQVLIRDSRIEFLSNENKRIPVLEEKVRTLERQLLDRDDTIARLTKRVTNVESEQKDRNHENKPQVDSPPAAGAAHPE